MSAVYPLTGVSVLIAGSAAETVDASSLRRAHSFVTSLVRCVLRSGGGVVVLASEERIPAGGHELSLTFDWTVLRAIDEHLPALSPAGMGETVVVTSQKAWTHKLTDAHRTMLARLTARGLVRLVYVPDEIYTGGNIADAQVQNAQVMVALAGQKGVLDRAAKMRKKTGIIVPLDLLLGWPDGGAIRLGQELISDPVSCFPRLGSRCLSRLPSISLSSNATDVDSVAAAVVELISAESASGAAEGPADVVIVTALPVELRAVLALLGIATDPGNQIDSGPVIWRTTIPSTRAAQQPLRVAVSCLGGSGNMPATAATTELIEALSPSLVVMVGIAAGRRQSCRLGDVLIAERVVAYESSAAVDDATEDVVFRSRSDTFQPGSALMQDLIRHVRDEVATSNRIARRLLAANSPLPASIDSTAGTSVVMPRLATIGSGDKLLRSSVFFERLRATVHGKIEVVDMESAGVAVASARRGTSFLVVRGITDHGDADKDDRFHECAAFGAAAAAIDFLSESFSHGS